MKRTIILACLLLAACTSANREVLDASRELDAALRMYEANIDAKIKSQRAFYNKRETHLVEARKEMIGLGLDQVRATRAVEEASRVAANPDAARPGWLLRYLLQTSAAEKALDASLRSAADGADKTLRDSLKPLSQKKKEIDAIQEILVSLAKAPSSKDDAKAILGFVKEASKKIGETQ